jgi:hypothetical protein
MQYLGLEAGGSEPKLITKEWTIHEALHLFDKSN